MLYLLIAFGIFCIAVGIAYFSEPGKANTIPIPKKEEVSKKKKWFNFKRNKNNPIEA